MNAILVKAKVLSYDGAFFNCVIGKNGISSDKVEGDWKTPVGIFNIQKVFFRKDRLPDLDSDFEMIPLEKKMAWCDDAKSSFYNRLVALPFNGSHEVLWREDELYDIIVVLDYNTHPVVFNKGSAIFIHVTRPDMEYTKGCIALPRKNLISLLTMIKKGDMVDIQGE